MAKFITDAVSFGRGSWEIATTTTRRDSLHALYLKCDEVTCFGVQTSPGTKPSPSEIETFLIAIETQLKRGGFPDDYGMVEAQLEGFSSLAYLSGAHRQFPNGWSGELHGIRVTHVFPCFDCELDAKWPSKKFVATARDIPDLFDLARPPSPFIQITMEGKAFSPPVSRWASVQLRMVLGYVPALTNDPSAILNVRNIAGEILTLNRETGWDSYKDKITAHAQLRRITA